MVAWLPTGAMFVAYNGEEIGIYEVSSTKIESRKFSPNSVVKRGICHDFSATDTPLVSLLVFLEQGSDSLLHESIQDSPQTEEDIHTATVFVAGLSATDETPALIWKVSDDNSGTDDGVSGKKAGERLSLQPRNLGLDVGSPLVSIASAASLLGFSFSHFVLFATVSFPPTPLPTHSLLLSALLIDTVLFFVDVRSTPTTPSVSGT